MERGGKRWLPPFLRLDGGRTGGGGLGGQPREAPGVVHAGGRRAEGPIPSTAPTGGGAPCSDAVNGSIDRPAVG
ncbi:hypothetical protein Sjap_017353 [Stephania japonica]|uniref:Uncharacterized protein n=1 Tax=Stephania japonica TaxID=461633 RepID=A0AAP0I640_9MAGN